MLFVSLSYFSSLKVSIVLKYLKKKEKKEKDIRKQENTREETREWE